AGRGPGGHGALPRGAARRLGPTSAPARGAGQRVRTHRPRPQPQAGRRRMTRPYVGVTGPRTYLPSGRLSSADLASTTSLPAWVVTDKLGIFERVVAGPDDHPTAM